MGNTIFLTDSSGTVIASYAYSPYGEILSSTGSIENPFTWQGQFGVMKEGDSGLYYMRARYYDSQIGRFLSRDPVSSAHSMEINPYQYALGNPMINIDPLGLRPLWLEWRMFPVIPGPDGVGGTPFWPSDETKREAPKKFYSSPGHPTYTISAARKALKKKAWEIYRSPIAKQFVFTNKGNIQNVRSAEQLEAYRAMNCYEFIEYVAWLVGGRATRHGVPVVSFDKASMIRMEREERVWDRKSSIPAGMIVCGWAESFFNWMYDVHGCFHFAISIGGGDVISFGSGGIKRESISSCFPSFVYRKVAYGDYNWKLHLGVRIVPEGSRILEVDAVSGAW